MPRTRTESGLLHELEFGDERDVVGERRLTTRKWVVPADAEHVAPDHGRQCQAEALATVGVGNWVRDLAGDLDLFCAPLDRDLAVDMDPVARAFDRARLEGKLRVALGIEEVGRLEMSCKIRVFDLNRSGLRRSLENAVYQDGVELAEAA